MSMLTPTSLYSNEVNGCWAMPPVAMGENVVTGTGTLSPKRACAVWPSIVRSWGLASRRDDVSLCSSR